MSTSGGSAGGTTSPLTTKGDVWGYSTVDARVPVGANGRVLTANSAAALGVDWEVAAPGSTINPIQAGVLVNATSPGDAGNRADHFTGSALSGAWSQEGDVGGTNLVANSVWANSGIGGGETGWWQAYTPSGAFTVEAAVRLISNNNQLEFAVKDATAGKVAVGNWIIVEIANTGVFTLYKALAGVVTSLGSVTDARANGHCVYLRLSRDATVNWSAWYSYDRAYWIPIASAIAVAAITVAKIGQRIVGSGVVPSFDFVDVVA